MGSQRVVIVGCGFLGGAAAFLFSEAGWEVLGLCATENSAKNFSNKPFLVRAIDITRTFIAPDGWQTPDLLIHCVSSNHGGVDAYRAVYRDGLENVLNTFTPHRVIFTGSTSVYSQIDGSWVTEESPAQPVRETGHVLLEAEALARQANGVIARLSGIYGPGRSAFLKKFLERTAFLQDGGERWINQIHQEDGAAALFHLAQSTTSSEIYNVCDNTPATEREVYGWIAEYLGRPIPPTAPADRNRKRGWTNKKVSNAKLRATGWNPRYPSYRDAIPDIGMP